jgi:hypothetical protein
MRGMGLVNCAECGAEISKKATSCPKCGSPIKKKTSRSTWLIVILFVVGYLSYTSLVGDVEQAKNSTQSNTGQSSNPKSTTQTESSWKFSLEEDEMTGSKTSATFSELASPTVGMSFPYSDMKASIVVVCDTDSEWTYISLSVRSSLNRNKTTFNGDTISFTTNIKWNDEITESLMTLTPLAKFIRFGNSKLIIDNLIKYSNVLIEIPFSDLAGGKRYFNFPLNGSSDAINKIRSDCKTF